MHKSEPKNCPICKASDWEDLDHHRSQRYWYNSDFRFDEPVGFKICKGCGFCTYNYIENYAEMYNDIRQAIGAINTITGNRKRLYHCQFLDEPLSNRIVESALDIGCAHGVLLDTLRNVYGVKTLYGTEYSDKCRAFGRNEYRLNIGTDIPEGSTYDFISYYHVLEHIPYPDRELEKIKKHLNPGGLLYISVPVWFARLEEASGTGTLDFENLFHVNHINTWSPQGFKNLLHNAGLEIIKYDNIIYGDTVLCQVGEPEPMVKEDWQGIVKIFEAQKKAMALNLAKDFEGAIEAYPNFPDTWNRYALSVKKMKDFPEQISILERGMEATGGYHKVKETIATLHAQWDESGDGPPRLTNNVRTAEKMLREIQKERNNENIVFMLAMIEGNYKKNPREAVKLLKELAILNPARWGECANLIGKFQTE